MDAGPGDGPGDGYRARARDLTGAAVNLVPAQYREVSVAEVPVPLEEGALRAYLAGRDVYRRTRYVIARNGAASMVIDISGPEEV